MRDDRVSADAGRWIILRMAGPRTLPVVRSLTAAGIEAWTPTLITTRKRPRSPVKVEREAPIMPTFAFAPERHLDELLAIRRSPVSPHPAFSVFRFAGEVHKIRAGKLAALRALEAAEAEAYRLQKERANPAPTKLRGIMPALGATVRVKGESILFAGMSGTVVKQKDRVAKVDFGGTLLVDIETWLLAEDEVEAAGA